MNDAQTVLIVGAGPVGLLLANLLGQLDVPCRIIDKRSTPNDQSRAIGVTPPSLAILRRLELDQQIIVLGIKVEEAGVSNERGTLGRLSFAQLPGDYRFILAIPQSDIMRVLARNLARFPCVTHQPGIELVGLTPQTNGVTVRLRSDGGPREEVEEVLWVVGCDGRHSTVRGLAGFGYRSKGYQPHFFMEDFEDRTLLGREAHLFFTARGSVESFPLPSARRRWVILSDVPPDQAGPNHVADRVQALTRFNLGNCHGTCHTHFRPERLLCRHYFRGRVILCGDAAHVMSPIGGQGMNIGLADAEFLADILAHAKGDAVQTEILLRKYEHHRRCAFLRAANRAAWAMWLGTRTGRTVSGWRSWLIRSVLLRPPFAQRLTSHFAMLTAPYRSMTEVPEPT